MRLINADVIAYGAAYGQLRGQIAALFYRHRSIGGFDDVTDFLIAPQHAAVAVVQLMDRTAKAVDPTALVTAYAATPGGTSRAVTRVLWDKVGDATNSILADGAVTLAAIWESVWTQGKGNTRIPAKSLAPASEADLQALYADTQHPFVPSLDLDAIAAVLT